MSGKRSIQDVNDIITLSKRRKSFEEEKNSYLITILEECGLSLKPPPDKNIATTDTVHIIRNIRKSLQKHSDYPRNALEMISNLQKECNNLNLFKHYLYPNIVRISSENNCEIIYLNDSVIKILLNVPILQSKLIDFVFEKAIDLAADSKCGPWIQTIMKCFSSLDNLVDHEKMSTNLINLLDIASERLVRLEIITAIPDIVGDQEHDNVATEMSRILSEDHDLIPAILDCLTYLCLSDQQYEELQKKTLNILMSLSKCNYFPNFVKFLLITGRMNDQRYLETIIGIRNALGWSSLIASPQDIATSQVLTAQAIRTSMISSKVIATSWLKVVTNCKESSDHKPIDLVIMIILYSTSEEKQKQVENFICKQIKLNILKEELIDEAFEKFKPTIKDNLRHIISLTNSLLKTKSDPLIQSFAAHIYTKMLSKLEESCQTIVAELLQLGLDCKQCIMNILIILNKVASKDILLLKPQCIQMLILLDRTDDMNLLEIRATMNLLCNLAYSIDNSVIRDDIHMIIRKELGSSNLSIKMQGIIAGIHAVKFLMCAQSENDRTIDFPDDISYSSVNHLAEGDLREAAQIIELISCSTRQFPDMIVFFYDELCEVVKPVNKMNKNFLAWLTDAVTNDLQQNFIVDNLETDKIGDLKLSMQYCQNSDSEMDEVIAINIGGLTLQQKEDISICLLPPLFQLVQTLHLRQHENNLSSIDALLGCSVIMPVFDIDDMEEFNNSNICCILDCLIYCANWFRELINAFATQTDDALKTKIFNRILQTQQIEALIGKIMMKTNIIYRPPIYSVRMSQEQTNDKIKSQSTKQKAQKKSNQDVTALPETIGSQQSQNNANTVLNKIDGINNISKSLRPFNLNILNLLKSDIREHEDTDSELNIETLVYLLKNICEIIGISLISKIKRNTFLTKPDRNDVYDKTAAENSAKLISFILPNIGTHMTFCINFLETNAFESDHEDGLIYSSKIINCVTCLEYIYNFYTIYFKWIGFKSGNMPLLKTSLRTIAVKDKDNAVTLKDLVIAATKYLQSHEKYCLQFATAVSLIELLKALKEHYSNSTILKIIRDTAKTFLMRQWKTSDGVLEKGLIYNQSIDTLANVYFIHNEIIELKKITLLLVNDIQALKSRNDTLNSFKSINKANFTVLYRNLGTALHEVAKKHLTKGLTNSEHLELWKDVALILRCMSDIAKSLDNRNNLSAFFKKSLPVIKLFLSQGMPIIELQFKTETQEVLEILKILQQSTRFLQSLCCHSRLKKDTVLISKVPYMRQLLETIIYRVKAALTANNCSEAFWMGNLKNKNIHGEVIATQQSVESEESVEDCDDQLPEDDDYEDSDEDMLNPDSKSLSDIV
ncbi:Fanconi anemia group D2 protein [Leptidea sinapis]|uniref:Fanconi anemia group D2 protein n=1 Tax=Leptidea sinapis TaxID=189913 RepID=UPI0021C44D85|nr:Fanconi anemia group D2 protein [Leptidea sinapis]